MLSVKDSLAALSIRSPGRCGEEGQQLELFGMVRLVGSSPSLLRKPFDGFCRADFASHTCWALSSTTLTLRRTGSALQRSSFKLQSDLNLTSSIATCERCDDAVCRVPRGAAPRCAGATGVLGSSVQLIFIALPAFLFSTRVLRRISLESVKTSAGLYARW